MSTTDSEDPETEIEVSNIGLSVQTQLHVEPAQNVHESSPYEEQLKIQEVEDVNFNIELAEKLCIFPFIDLETAGNGLEDWEIFNVLCGVTPGNNKNVVVS